MASCSKKPKRQVSYDTSWEKEFPISAVSHNKHAFYCIPCKKSVSCGHMGKGDVVRHCDPTADSIHNKNVKAAGNQRSLHSMLVSTDSNKDSKVTRAEILHTNFIVQHNLAFNVADHLSKLYHEMFPDSQIAGKFGCARTKTTQILNKSLMPEIKNFTVNHMKTNPYSLVNDGTSDTSLKKMNAACALIFDIDKCQEVQFRFYNMCSTTGEDASTAETLFAAINDSLVEDEIEWKNCLCVGMDNCNTNMGNRNSIKTRILQKNPSTLIAGCSCHLAHLAAGAGGKGFREISNFDVEDHQVDLYYYFKRSTRRKGILKEYFDFVDLEWKDMTRFVKTRWLSLETCCDKELKKYPAFKSMFESRTQSSSKEDIGEAGDGTDLDKSADKRFKRLKKDFTDPMTEIYLSFYSAVLPIFTHYNMFLQRSDPLPHKVYPITEDLKEKIASRFLRDGIKINENALDKEENFLPLEEMNVGLSTTMLYKKFFNAGDIEKSDCTKFLKSARNFFKCSLAYVLKKLKLDEFWVNAVWIDFFNRQDCKWDHVNFFVVQFNDILDFSPHQFNQLYDEFRSFMRLKVDEINLEEAVLKVYEDGSKEYRMDTIWYLINNLTSSIGNNKRFGLLAQVARTVLIIPHSNAGIERVYSLVNKNKRDGSERNRLDIDGSLSSILAVKLDKPESKVPCFKLRPSDELIKTAKKATKAYNKEHCSSKK